MDVLFGIQHSSVTSGPQREPGLVLARVPGCEALAFQHFLRAVFCVIEEPEAPAGAMDLTRLDAQTVFACTFADRRGAAGRRALLGPGSGVSLLTAIAHPIRVRAAVYAHAIATEPDLPERSPAVFGSFDRFLLSGVNPVTRGLAAALGTRRCTIGDFWFAAVEERMDASIRAFAQRLNEALEECAESRAVRRTRALLDATLRSATPLDGAFACGCETAESPTVEPALAKRHRAANRADYAFYESALGALTNSKKGKRTRGRRPASGTPPADPVFVFNHLPKCYGSSMRLFLARGFALIEDHTRFLGVDDVIRDAPCETRLLAADTVLCGHFCDGDYRLPARYPEVWQAGGRFHIFAFVRHPLEMAVSNYRHVIDTEPEQAAREPDRYRSLESYVLSLRNPTAFRLGCGSGDWRDVVSRHFFFGAAERMAAGIPRLLGLMEEILRNSGARGATVERALAGIARLRGGGFPHANAARPAKARDAGLPAAAMERFVENHAVDFAIYEAALEADAAPCASSGERG